MGFEKEEVKAAKVEMEELKEKREEKAEAKASEATEKAAAKPKTQKAQKMWRKGQTMDSVDEKMTMKMNAIRAQMKKDKAAKHLGLASISSEPATLAKEFEKEEVKAAKVEMEELEEKRE